MSTNGFKKRLRQGARRTESLPYLPRWLILGSLIGISAGVGAVVFFEALRLATYLFLDVIGGYRVPLPIGEGAQAASSGFSRPWAVPLSVSLGGLLAGAAIFGWAPEAEGHGTDSAIDAVHHNPYGIRARVSAVKIVASALTIGSGGSGGREGPTGQISAGFASLLARADALSPATAKLAVTAGIGSGIGAIFGAPLGGAVLGPEIVYTDDFEAEAIIPSLIASVVAFAIFGFETGYGPLFGSHETFGFQPHDLGYYLLIGILCGSLARAYSAGFYDITRRFRALVGIPQALRPALAGLAVGTASLVIPQILGTGYGWVQRSMGPALLTLPLWVVLAAPLARIAATGFSIGSGGSGGIFGPGLVIGAFTGAAVWRIAHDLGLAVPHDPAPFVIVAMVACFGSISHAPVGVLIMVTEMTGSLHLVLASMAALIVAMTIVGNRTIYKAQLRDRSESPTQRVPVVAPVGAVVSVAEIMAPPRLLLRLADLRSAAEARLAEMGLPGAPVVDATGAYRGIVDATGADSSTRHRDSPNVGDAIDRHGPVISVGVSFEAALDALAVAPGSWVPVVDSEHAVVGIISASEVVKGYQQARRPDGAAAPLARGDVVVISEEVQEGSAAAGVELRSLHLAPPSVVVSIHRRGVAVLPTADTILECGDVLTVLTRGTEVVAVRRVLASDPDWVRAGQGHGLAPGGLI